MVYHGKLKVRQVKLWIMGEEGCCKYICDNSFQTGSHSEGLPALAQSVKHLPPTWETWV